MDRSKRLRPLKAKAWRTNRRSTRSQLRPNRTLRLESLDQRMLMAADSGSDIVPPIPEAHVLTAITDDMILASDLESHGHDFESDHDHNCHCHQCLNRLGHAAFGGGGGGNAPNGKWSQPDGFGTPVTVTYSYAGLLDGNFATGSLTERELRASVEEAFGLWANYAPLNFVEVVDSGPAIFINGQDNTSYRSGDTPDIRIGHHTIDGLSGTLAYAYFPETNYWGASGDIHFDTAEPWQLGNDDQGNGAWATDFLEVMTHEIGHALGLDHESNATSVMHPTNSGSYDGLDTGFLYQHDIDSIRDIYGTGIGSVSPIVTNQAPLIAPIADQTMAAGQSVITVTVPVDAIDPDGDSLTYEASVLSVDPMQYEAFRLKETYSLQPASNDHHNARGYGEKYFHGNGSRWFFMLPDGGVHQWAGSIDGSPEVGKLDANYHNQLALLMQASEPVAQPIPANVVWTGSSLTVTASTAFATTFMISVDVADRYESSNEVFFVSLVNNAPVIDVIPDQSTSVESGSITVEVSAVDPEGDALVLAANVTQVESIAMTAHQLQQQYGFRAARTESENNRGHGEKYFYGDGTRWFFMLPDGEIHRWAGSIAASPQIGVLDAGYHADLSTLYEATEPDTVPVDVVWAGGQVTVDWGSGRPSDLIVTLTASDQQHDTMATFNVEFTNSTPLLAEIEDQNVSSGQSTISVPISASDADDDTLQFSATASVVSLEAVAAHELKTEFGLYWTGRDSYNARGYGEKYFRGEGSRWFFMLPDGEIHRWRGSVDRSPMIGQVDPSYHADLEAFLTATEPVADVIDITMVWQESSGNTELLIEIPDQFVGTFHVTVTTSDGENTADTQFAVNVISPPQGQSAPVAATLLSMQNAIDQVMSGL